MSLGEETDRQHLGSRLLGGPKHLLVAGTYAPGGATPEGFAATAEKDHRTGPLVSIRRPQREHKAHCEESAYFPLFTAIYGFDGYRWRAGRKMPGLFASEI